MEEKQSVPPDLNKRYSGDEALSNEQVSARRQREYTRSLKPYQDKVNHARQEILDAKLTIEKLLSEITEAQNLTRLKCLRLFNHTRQRIDIYYNAALLKHPKKDEMPPSISTKLIPEGEYIYLSQHTGYLEEVEKYISYLKHTYDIVENQETYNKSINPISNIHNTHILKEVK